MFNATTPATLRDRLTQLQSLADTFARRLALHGPGEARWALKGYAQASATPPDDLLRNGSGIDDLGDARVWWQAFCEIGG